MPDFFGLGLDVARLLENLGNLVDALSLEQLFLGLIHTNLPSSENALSPATGLLVVRRDAAEI